jgi:hypothetical protein
MEGYVCVKICDAFCGCIAGDRIRSIWLTVLQWSVFSACPSEASWSNQFHLRVRGLPHWWTLAVSIKTVVTLLNLLDSGWHCPIITSGSFPAFRIFLLKLKAFMWPTSAHVQISILIHTDPKPTSLPRTLYSTHSVSHLLKKRNVLFRSDNFIYSRTSNNGHCRGTQILSVIGGVR